MLSSTEQKILLEILYYSFRNLKFSYTSQQVIRSNRFYSFISGLERKGLININFNGRKTFYTLTDYGRIEANQRCREFDTDRKYWFLYVEILNVIWNK